MTRLALSHEDIARELTMCSGALDFNKPVAIASLRRGIAEELQRAFDLGFRAAGGTIAAISTAKGSE